MSRILVTTFVLCAIAAPTLLAHDSERVVETRTVTRTISLAPGGDLVVENLWGDVRVTGTSGSEIRLVAEETVRARDDRRFQLAREEVSLETFETKGGVVICVDGPFRDPDDCTQWSQGERGRDPGYRVFYDMELEVPRDVRLRVRTIEGELVVEGIRGEFDVAGVNGGIEMHDIDGSGHVHTVNGPVRVDFAGNPEADCEFKTINGEIEVTFPGNLSADLSFETMNGDVLSDFEYEPLPAGELQREKKRGRTTWKLDPSTSIRIASGGPRFSFENINGDILIRRGR